MRFMILVRDRLRLKMRAHADASDLPDLLLFTSICISAHALRRAADRIVTNVHSTQALPLASIRTSQLDGDWADLVWMALPADALQAFRTAVEAGRSPGGAVRDGKMDRAVWSAVPLVCRGGDIFRGGGGKGVVPRRPDESPSAVLGRARVGEAEAGAKSEYEKKKAEVKGAGKKGEMGGKANVPAKLFNAVREAIRVFDMLREGDKILVGLSGGKDSLTLLHCMLEVKRKCPCE